MYDEDGKKYEVEDSEGSEDPDSLENAEEGKGEDDEAGHHEDYAKKKRTKTKA